MYVFIRGIVLLMFLSAVTNHMVNLSVQDSNNFGPYYLNYTRFDLCMGPKSKNLTLSTITVTSKGFTFYGQFNLTFLATTQLDEVKIVVYAIKNKKINNELWTYKVKEPCKHFLFAEIIKLYLKATNCNINKGTYFQMLKFDDIQKSFFGTSFFYGEFLLKVTVISKKGNIMCLYVGLVFTKK